MKKHEITYQEWTCKPRGTCWKDYIRLQRKMRKLIAASLLSLTVNVILLGVIIL
jgi:Leu/Phe-tRNA-protein transferase